MVKLALTLAAQLNGVTDVKPSNGEEESFDYAFTIICGSCKTASSSPIHIFRNQIYPVPNSRGEAHLAMRCKECKREMTANILTEDVPYTAELSGTSLPITEFECRGCEISSFHAEFSNWECNSLASSTKFKDVSLAEEDWYEYDEAAKEEVSITDIKFGIKRI